jgi:hypothetical protein
MGELRADWRLRLRREDAHGPVCGAGVLVDQYTALTCAHVVRRPDAIMWLEFAENSALEPVSARVLPGGWLPERADGEDVAVLRLDSPRPQARRALLDPGLWGGMEVYTTGYAEGFDGGVSLWGRIGGVSGERVQLDAVIESEAAPRSAPDPGRGPPCGWSASSSAGVAIRSRCCPTTSGSPSRTWSRSSASRNSRPLSRS